MVRLLRKLVAACVAVQYGLMYTKSMEIRLKIMAIEKSCGSYLGKCVVSEVVEKDLRWWIKNIMCFEKIFKLGRIACTLYTNASSLGWGATDNETKIFSF